MNTRYHPRYKTQAYRLRDSGMTYRDIAKKLGVSKSTVCLWIQAHIAKLTESYKRPNA